ncbi:ankyrin repeat domain-containing protein [Criblamydia sequanensis]|uniref:Ankyrin repeat-containing protein n=1 Tax=Candidatus Criblamydia sequanensis CRIB-18 TaxID=1437425 RepID=A0A090DXZ8_9BACT|nr:ankyrin repeat domain-containing protein [Criblamydia sequanensis]CDR33644.1 Ankyrin repeat-containing protein [Criblamydia sequanensis CRIB-18]
MNIGKSYIDIVFNSDTHFRIVSLDFVRKKQVLPILERIERVLKDGMDYIRETHDPSFDFLTKDLRETLLEKAIELRNSYLGKKIRLSSNKVRAVTNRILYLVHPLNSFNLPVEINLHILANLSIKSLAAFALVNRESKIFAYEVLSKRAITYGYVENEESREAEKISYLREFFKQLRSFCERFSTESFSRNFVYYDKKKKKINLIETSNCLKFINSSDFVHVVALRDFYLNNYKFLENFLLSSFNKRPLKHRKFDCISSAMYLASEYNNKEVLSLFLKEKDQNLNRYSTISADGWTPLHVAAYHGHVDIVKILLDNGAKVNLHTQRYHKSALQLACEPINSEPAFPISSERWAIIKLLLENGANPNWTDASGFSPMQYADLMNKWELTELFTIYSK